MGLFHRTLSRQSVTVYHKRYLCLFPDTAVALEPSDWLNAEHEHDTCENVDTDAIEHRVPTNETQNDSLSPIEQPGTSAPPLQEEVTVTTQSNSGLDTEVLEILGEDPSLAEKRGKDIREEIASRFGHIATEGLSKDTRKELSLKYPIPSNCPRIDSPKINPEVKAAMQESFIKRDKGIEVKQKQVASAISCLGEIITTQLNSENKDKDLLQKLMDLGRLLCDVQHADSVTRRNFILFSLKKDMSEHLSSTKIDSFLFGESLAETLKAAKSINKSGVELKADQPNNNTAKRSKLPNQRNLNRKAPGPSYRQSGPIQRSREPAPRARAAPLPPAHSSRPWPRQQPPPPPPPPAQARRRF